MKLFTSFIFHLAFLLNHQVSPKGLFSFLSVLFVQRFYLFVVFLYIKKKVCVCEFNKMASPPTPSNFVSHLDICTLLDNETKDDIKERDIENISFSMFYQKPWNVEMIISRSAYYTLLINKYMEYFWSYPYLLNHEVQYYTGYFPVKYYFNVLSMAIQKNCTFDSIPLFTATEIKRLYRLERTRYLSLVQQVKEIQAKLKSKRSGLGLFKKKLTDTDALKQANLQLAPKLAEKLPLPWNKLCVNKKSFAIISQKKGNYWKKGKEHEILKEALHKLLILKSSKDMKVDTENMDIITNNDNDKEVVHTNPEIDDFNELETTFEFENTQSNSQFQHFVLNTTMTGTGTTTDDINQISSIISPPPSILKAQKTSGNVTRKSQSSLTTSADDLDKKDSCKSNTSSVMYFDMNEFNPKECLALTTSGFACEEYVIENGGYVRQKRILTKKGGFLLHSSPNMKIYEDMLYSMLVALSNTMKVSELLECVDNEEEYNKQVMKYVLLMAIRLGYMEYYPGSAIKLSEGWNQNILKSAQEAKRDVETQMKLINEMKEKSNDLSLSESIKAGLTKNFTILYPARLSGILMVGVSEGDGAKQIRLLGQKMLETGRIMPAESAELIALLPYNTPSHTTQSQRYSDNDNNNENENNNENIETQKEQEEQSQERRICASLRDLILTIMTFSANLNPPFPHFLQIHSASHIPYSKRQLMISRHSSLFVTVSSGSMPMANFPVIDKTINIGPTTPAAASILRTLWLYRICGCSPRGFVIPKGAELETSDIIYAAWKYMEEEEQEDTNNNNNDIHSQIQKLDVSQLDTSSDSFRKYKQRLQSHNMSFIITDASPKVIHLNTISLRNIPSDKTVCLLLDVDVFEHEQLKVSLPIPEASRVQKSEGDHVIPFLDKLISSGLADCTGQVIFIVLPPNESNEKQYLPLDVELGVPLDNPETVAAFSRQLGEGLAGVERMHSTCRRVSESISDFATCAGFDAPLLSRDAAPLPTRPVVLAGAKLRRL